MSEQILTRTQALSVGRLFYFTGKPCLRGHVGNRFASTGGCVQCLKMAKKDKPKGIDGRRAVAKLQDGLGMVPFTLMVHPDDMEAVRALADGMFEARWNATQPEPTVRT